MGLSAMMAGHDLSPSACSSASTVYMDPTSLLLAASHQAEASDLKFERLKAVPPTYGEFGATLMPREAKPLLNPLSSHPRKDCECLPGNHTCKGHKRVSGWNEKWCALLELSVPIVEYFDRKHFVCLVCKDVHPNRPSLYRKAYGHRGNAYKSHCMSIAHREHLSTFCQKHGGRPMSDAEIQAHLASNSKYKNQNQNSNQASGSSAGQKTCILLHAADQSCPFCLPQRRT